MNVGKSGEAGAGLPPAFPQGPGAGSDKRRLAWVRRRLRRGKLTRTGTATARAMRSTLGNRQGARQSPADCLAGCGRVPRRPCYRGGRGAMRGQDASGGSPALRRKACCKAASGRGARLQGMLHSPRANARLYHERARQARQHAGAPALAWPVRVGRKACGRTEDRPRSDAGGAWPCPEPAAILVRGKASRAVAAAVHCCGAAKAAAAARKWRVPHLPVPARGARRTKKRAKKRLRPDGLSL